MLPPHDGAVCAFLGNGDERGPGLLGLGIIMLLGCLRLGLYAGVKGLRFGLEVCVLRVSIPGYGFKLGSGYVSTSWYGNTQINSQKPPDQDLESRLQFHEIDTCT